MSFRSLLLFCSIFIFGAVACKREYELLGLHGTNNVPSNSTYSTGELNHPIDVISYRGQFYVLYIPGSNVLSGYVKVFNPDPNSLDNEGYPKLKKGNYHSIKDLDGSDGEFVVWGGRLFLTYPYEHVYSSDIPYDIWTAGVEIIPSEEDKTKFAIAGDGSDRFLPCKRRLPSSLSQISVTEMGGYLYCAVGNEDGIVEIYKTTSDEPSRSPSWNRITEVRKSNGDAPEKFNVDKGKDPWKLISASHMEDGRLMSELFFCRQKSKVDVEVYKFDPETKTWTYYSHKMPEQLSGIGTFDVVQGYIDGAGHDPSQVPLQLICSKGDYIVAQPFYIEEPKSWGPATKLRNHNGVIAATMGTTPVDDATDQMHLFMFVGEKDDNLDIDRYTSFSIRREFYTYSNYGGIVASQDSLRPLATLIGIIEGPPPTMLNTSEDFDKVTAFYWPSLEINAENSETCQFSHGATAGIGGYLGVNGSTSVNIGLVSTEVSSWSFKAGVDFAYNYKMTESKMVAYNNKQQFVTGPDSRSKAILLYLVPELYTTISYLCKPYKNNGKAFVDANGVTRTVIDDDKIWVDAFNYSLETRNSILYPVEVDLSAAPFNIANINSLESWTDRFPTEIVANTQSSVFSTTVVVDQGESSVGVQGESYRSDNHDWSFNAYASYDYAQKQGLAFGIHGNLGYQGTKMSTNKIGAGVTMKYPLVRSSDLKNTNVRSFVSSFVLIYSKKSPIAKEYYEALKEYMVDGEEPWILRYQVDDIQYR